jgi:hypothetical protein
MNDDVSNIEKLPQPVRLAANSTTPICLDRTIQPCRSHLAVKRKVERKSGSPGPQALHPGRLHAVFEGGANQEAQDREQDREQEREVESLSATCPSGSRPPNP